MKKILLNILIGLAFLLFIYVISKGTKMCYSAYKTKDSVITEYYRFDLDSYRDFELFLYLCDSLLNYHKYPITKEQLIDYFTIDSVPFVDVSDTTSLKIQGLGVTFRFSNNEFYREDLPYYHTDSIFKYTIFSKQELMYYLTTKKTFHRTVIDTSTIDSCYYFCY
ncbi:MAG: hypothetical protein PUC50_16530 [Bacteroidales bacterium]|nr:hypothetical protein [Bacteroidales bacterium]